MKNDMKERVQGEKNLGEIEVEEERPLGIGNMNPFSLFRHHRSISTSIILHCRT